MAIVFKCLNEKCGKALRMPDGWVGRKDRCPRCGTEFVVPAPEGGGAGDESLATALERTHERLLQKQAEEDLAEQVKCCPACQRRFSALRKDCPFCGWEDLGDLPEDTEAAPGAPAPGPELPPEPAPAAVMGSFPWSAIRVRRPGLGAGHGLLLFVLLVGFWAGVRFLAAFGELSERPGSVQMLVLAGGGLVALLILGYLVEVYLRIICGAYLGQATASRPREGRSMSSLRTACQLPGLVLVYAVPIVTLPLLPVALLVMSRSRTARALNLPSHLRTIVKHPEHFAMLWLFLATWAILTVVAGHFVAEGLDLIAGKLPAGTSAEKVQQALALIAAAVLAAAVGLPLGALPSRWIGLYGRYNVDAFDELPSRPRRLVAAAVWLAGLVGYALLLAWWILPVMGKGLA